MNISVKINRVRKVFFFILSCSDFRSSEADAQQLIKHLSLCPGQQSLRDFKESVTELFVSLKNSYH